MPLRLSGGRSTKRRSRVVVDTGILVSAFAFGGVPRKAVIKAFHEADIFVSQPLLTEYRDVPLMLESKRRIDHSQLKALISGIASFTARAKLVQPTKKLSLCRDPQDDMLLECCLEAKADFLITGDKDLLAMDKPPSGLTILSPSTFIKET
jgi:putative PIN family toxin of toxin-antitoxin system